MRFTVAASRPLRAPKLLDMASVGLLVFALGCSMVENAAIFDVYAPDMTTYCLYAKAALIALLLARGVAAGLSAEGLSAPVLAAVAWLALILFQKAMFSLHAGEPYNWHGIVDNMDALLFLVFMACARDPAFVAKLLYGMIVPYLALYLYTTQNPPLLVNPEEMSAFLGASSGRDERVFLASCFAAYAAFFAFDEIRFRRNLMHAIPLAMALAAIVLSESRVFISVFAVIAVAALVSWRVAGYVGCAIFVAVLCLNAYGFIDTSFNPYAFLVADDSGWARAASFERGRDLAFAHPLTGVGVDMESSPAFRNFVSTPHFFSATDLGPFGVFLTFGAVGFALFMVLTFSCFFPDHRLRMFGAHAQAVKLTLMVAALYGIIAPMLAFGSGRPFVALLIWASFKGCRAARGRPAAPGLVPFVSSAVGQRHD